MASLLQSQQALTHSLRPGKEGRYCPVRLLSTRMFCEHSIVPCFAGFAAKLTRAAEYTNLQRCTRRNQALRRSVRADAVEPVSESVAVTITETGVDLDAEAKQIEEQIKVRLKDSGNRKSMNQA